MQSAQTACPTAPQTRSMMVPKRVRYLSESEIPNDLKDYSKTPGGTLYGTTPGGTRIIYELDQMMKLRNSPMSQTPPRNLPFIPGVTKETEFNRKSPMLINDLNNNKLTPSKPKIIEERSETDFELELYNYVKFASFKGENEICL